MTNGTGAERAASTARAAALAAGLLAAAAGMGGCRVDEDNLHRWETTVHGPDKLKAVLRHDKYDTALRVESAMSLIRMKPRGGRRIGLGLMTEALAEVPPEPRGRIVAGLVPLLMAELRKPPPRALPGQPVPADPSFPYKDAAYGMLTYEKTAILTDKALEANLRAALVDWAMLDFEHRLDNRTQSYGMEQLLRFIGPDSVRRLPELIRRDATKIDAMASLIAEIGDGPTKEAASSKLVELARWIGSSAWLEEKKPELEARNKVSKLEPTEAQFKMQLQTYQDEELIRIFGAMKKVGGRPMVEHCLTFAGQKDQPEKRRTAALAALEGRLDRNNPEDVRRVLALVTSPDTPDGVLDLALMRIGEMPREHVAAKLYDLFQSERWKVRRAAATLLLKMSTAKHLDEFFSKLPDRDPRGGFALDEPLRYGWMIGQMEKKDGDPAEAVKKRLGMGSAAARTTALGYYYAHGGKAELAVVKAQEEDSTTAPKCDADQECKWICEVSKAGGKEREAKEIKTVGDFARHCVAPEIERRAAEGEKK